MKRPNLCFVGIAAILLILLGIGIFARLKGLAEGTEIIFAALAGIGILINAWIDQIRAPKGP